MIYADTAFFLALLKDSDWPQTSAKRLLQVHKDQIWTSPVTLIELLLVSAQFHIDPERLIADVLELTQIQGGEVKPILIAAHYIKSKGVEMRRAVGVVICLGCGLSVMIAERLEKMRCLRCGRRVE